MKSTSFLFPSLLSMVLAVTSLCSCNEKASESDKPAAGAPNYPYNIKHPDNWEVGSTSNTLIALKALKAWEDGKMDESMKYFADSVHVQFDGLDKKISNGELKTFLTDGWNSFKTVKEKMSDWESLVSKDKSEEWVKIKYTQTFETKSGVKDSAELVNGLQFKSGKIISLSEYTRKLH